MLVTYCFFFSVTAPRGLQGDNQCSGEIYRLHLQGRIAVLWDMSLLNGQYGYLEWRKMRAEVKALKRETAKESPKRQTLWKAFTLTISRLSFHPTPQ
jgi:hypothetical protein